MEPLIRIPLFPVFDFGDYVYESFITFTVVPALI
jgi:hypothetical protein